MKKFFSILILTLVFITSVNAQTVEDTKFFDNASITLKGGVTTPLYEPVNHFRGTYGLEVQKKLTPVFGLGLEGEWTANTWEWPKSNFGFNSQPLNWHYRVDYQYIGTFATTNLNNLFVGYKGTPRDFEVETVLGVGWGHIYTSNNQYDRNYVTTKVGLNLNYNFGPDKEFTISLKPSVLWNLTSSHHSYASYNINKAMLQLQVGLTYHFEGPTTRHFKICNKKYTESQMQRVVNESNNRINVLRAQMSENERVYNENLEALNNKNEELTQLLNECVNREDIETPYIPMPVQFKKRSAELVNADVILQDWFEMIQEDGGNYVIAGYASEEGTDEFNMELSRKRAENVMNRLIEMGVNPENLKAEGRGKTTEFGKALELNRVVIVE